MARLSFRKIIPIKVDPKKLPKELKLTNLVYHINRELNREIRNFTNHVRLVFDPKNNRIVIDYVITVPDDKVGKVREIFRKFGYSEV